MTPYVHGVGESAATYRRGEPWRYCGAGAQPDISCIQYRLVAAGSEVDSLGRWLMQTMWSDSVPALRVQVAPPSDS